MSRTGLLPGSLHSGVADPALQRLRLFETINLVAQGRAIKRRRRIGDTGCYGIDEGDQLPTAVGGVMVTRVADGSVKALPKDHDARAHHPPPNSHISTFIARSSEFGRHSGCFSLLEYLCGEVALYFSFDQHGEEVLFTRSVPVLRQLNAVL